MNFAQFKKSLGQVVQSAASTAKDLSSQVVHHSRQETALFGLNQHILLAAKLQARISLCSS